MGAHSPSSQRQPEDRHYTQLRASPGYGPRYTASRGYGPRYTAYLYLLFIYFYLIFILVLVSCLGSFSHSLSLYLWPLILSFFHSSLYQSSAVPPSPALFFSRLLFLTVAFGRSLCLSSSLFVSTLQAAWSRTVPLQTTPGVAGPTKVTLPLLRALTQP